jgi:phage baseplate assembly protein W
MSYKDAYIDAQYSGEDRASQIYKDLDLFFKAKSTDKDIAKVTNVTAVKRSIRNLVLTNPYERPFHPEIASGVTGILFEPMTPITAFALSQRVEDVIEGFEPRARLIGVRATPDLDRNAYEITIEFYVQNAPTELVDMTVMLETLR